MSTPDRPRAVWRRSSWPPAANNMPTEQVLRCGGPELSVDEAFLLMREREQERQDKLRAAAQEREKARRARRQPHPDDDDDADERPRPDRYAVTLLQQDGSAWGGGRDGDPGRLG